MLSTNQIVGFFDHQYVWKKSIDILDFLRGGNHQEKLASWDNHFWLVVASFACHPGRLLDFLIINISGKNQLTILSIRM